MKALLSLLCWCFTALWHILSNFGCGHLTCPHCCSASLLGSLPVLSAHSFASNRQLPFLIQQKGIAIEIISWSKVHGCEDRTMTVCIPGGRWSDWATAPTMKAIHSMVIHVKYEPRHDKTHLYHMSHVTRKPVFRVCNQVRLKPA